MSKLLKLLVLCVVALGLTYCAEDIAPPTDSPTSPQGPILNTVNKVEKFETVTAIKLGVPMFEFRIDDVSSLRLGQSVSSGSADLGPICAIRAADGKIEKSDNVSSLSRSLSHLTAERIEQEINDLLRGWDKTTGWTYSVQSDKITKFAEEIGRDANVTKENLRTLNFIHINAYVSTAAFRQTKSIRKPGVEDCKDYNYFVNSYFAGGFMVIGHKVTFKRSGTANDFLDIFKTNEPFGTFHNDSLNDKIAEFLKANQGELSIHVLQLGGNISKAKEIRRTTNCFGTNVKACKDTAHQFRSSFSTQFSPVLNDIYGLNKGWAVFGLTLEEMPPEAPPAKAPKP